jgi:hypothetical protein
MQIEVPQLLAQTDLEIKRLEDSRREHGWSPWALIAAVAAICWQLTGQLALPHRWDLVMLNWSLPILLFVAGRGILESLNKGCEPRRPGLRFYPANLVQSGTRAYRLFQIAKIGCAATLVWGQMAGLLGIVWISWFGFCLTIGLIEMCGTWTDMPLPVGTPVKEKPRSRAVTIALWLLHFSLLAVMLKQLSPQIVRDYSAADAQLALLSFALVEMAGMLLAFQVNEPQRKRLVHLRRMIGLGEVGAEEAKTRLEEIIYGSDIGVILKDRFTELREALSKLAGQLEQGRTLVRVASEIKSRKPEAEEIVRTASETFDHCELLLVQVWARSLAAKYAETGAEVLKEHAQMKVELAACKEQLCGLKDAIDAT